MTKDVKKIYDFVCKMEDFYYDKLTGGENIQKDIVNTCQATSFQRIRYFIESMEEDNGQP